MDQVMIYSIPEDRQIWESKREAAKKPGSCRFNGRCIKNSPAYSPGDEISLVRSFPDQGERDFEKAHAACYDHWQTRQAHLPVDPEGQEHPPVPTDHMASPVRIIGARGHYVLVTGERYLGFFSDRKEATGAKKLLEEHPEWLK